jgi:uncharacterized cupredoxin-like copper-binding protein
LRFAPLVFLLILGAGCSSDPGASERTITIEIEHSEFVPERLEVEAGETVTFVVRNGDPIDHEFILGDEAIQLVHEKGTEKHHGARPGEISIPAGETRETTYTFEEPGELIYGCHIFGHYDYGMRGAVEVR